MVTNTQRKSKIDRRTKFNELILDPAAIRESALKLATAAAGLCCLFGSSAATYSGEVEITAGPTVTLGEVLVHHDRSDGRLLVTGTIFSDSVTVKLRDETTLVVICASTSCNGDIAIASVTKVVFDASNGDDTFRNETDLPSVFLGGAGNDEHYGGGGVDHFFGGYGDDYSHGGRGNDFLYGEHGNDVLEGGNGNDYIDGGEGSDEVHGGLGADELHGKSGADTLVGGNGDDLLRGGLDSDIIYGGAGADIAHGDEGTDFLFGDEGSDRLYGGLNGDGIEGGAGSDELFGEEGNDYLYGGDGEDYVAGGDGDDVLLGNAGGDTIDGGDGDDEIEGGDGSDDLFGGPGDDDLTGNEGSDRIEGNGGNDWLSGGDGNDRLYGGAGDDALFGFGGRDGLFGGDGTDEVDGGIGGDRFLYEVIQDELDDILYTDGDPDDIVVLFDRPENLDLCDQSIETVQWSQDTIEIVDAGLALVHNVRTELLRGNSTYFGSTLKVALNHLGGGAGGCNVSREGYAYIVFDKDYIESTSIERVAQTVAHEIGHNYDMRLVDNNPFWDEFTAISGWTTEDMSGDPDYAYAGDDWWYDSTTSFARAYGRNDPLEDWATSFAAYVLSENEISYSGYDLSFVEDKLMCVEMLVESL